ncbi:polysaccharide deacetylase family protein [Stratiformator vulcanicus]|uniref:Poly-beta-1,6-N-acetyl-D-glucosamine N-deacetylase n=1 Tax=Stratiformator vulcanicus TaxID=2527980 RepID=A0A517R431_9PLAN|nr:polysaccharide deacetylase family protein [Stratiformator vulcanicus]QDT38638.1 Poly-beta-1,6-N-acetyl-D-glucosamine N-deacetylase precursor [Stratiformator vulcanicus]
MIAAPQIQRPSGPTASRWKAKVAAQLSRPLAASFGRRATGFGILMYHRVTDSVPGVTEPTWNVPPAQFRKQLAGLIRRGFEPWRLCDVLDASANETLVPGNAFVVTFDDGYANNYFEALPILESLDVPATVFISTAYLDSDQPFPSDDWEAAGRSDVPKRAWRPLTTEECRALGSHPLIDLGCHTHTHDDFRGRPDDLLSDLKINADILNEEFGVADPMFAFPYGTKATGFSGPVFADIAQRAGMRCALTTEDELVPRGRTPFDWGRFTAEADDNGATLAAKLSGWYEVVKESWHFVRGGFKNTGPIHVAQTGGDS